MPSKQQDLLACPPALFTFAPHFACYLHVRKPPRTSIVRALIGFVINEVDFAGILSPSEVDLGSITVADLHHGCTKYWAVG